MTYQQRRLVEDVVREVAAEMGYCTGEHLAGVRAAVTRAVVQQVSEPPRKPARRHRQEETTMHPEGWDQ